MTATLKLLLSQYQNKYILDITKVTSSSTKLNVILNEKVNTKNYTH